MEFFMEIQRIGAGPRMSKAVVYQGLVYLSGQIADRTKETGSVKEQAEEVLSMIDRLLAEAGTDKSKILSATIWLSDMSTFSEMNSVWDKWIVPGHPPARATVEAKLAAPHFKIEIAVIAAVS